eukprot:6735814-Pyramimonas_sp.AAC.1
MRTCACTPARSCSACAFHASSSATSPRATAASLRQSVAVAVASPAARRASATCGTIAHHQFNQSPITNSTNHPSPIQPIQPIQPITHHQFNQFNQSPITNSTNSTNSTNHP